MSALNRTTTGNANTASGYSALRYNIGGSFNTANGSQALARNNASRNTASGYGALNANTSETPRLKATPPPVPASRASMATIT